MYLVMTYLEVRLRPLEKTQKHYINAEGDEAGDFQLLEVNDLAFICGRFSLPWDSGLLKGVNSGGFRALVAQKSWGRYRSHSISGL